MKPTVLPPPAAPTPAAAKPTHYSIAPKNLAAHLFAVTVTIDAPNPAGQRFMLPTWIPGSYMIREFARNIVTLVATSDGLPVAVEKIDKTTWQCAAAAGVLRMFYYARLADTFLAKSPIFGALDRELRWDYVRKMTLQRYNPGQPILREGETGDALFMIRTGTVQIFTGTGPDSIKLADLPAGEIFGEIAVINLQPRTATVVAGTEVELYRLDRESARRMLAANASIAGKVKDIAEARVRSTIDAMITGSVGNTGRA